jgi:urease accessory protein
VSGALFAACTDAAAAHDRGWRAELSLEFAYRDGRSVLATRQHHGPLVVQKPLYEEGDRVCQAVVVHPPGGIAGGDRLLVNACVRAGAHALLTSPGAAKWYRSAGAWASQTLRLCVEGGGVLEWLPQETILFDGTRADVRTRVELSGDALYVGWEVLCFGRTASGERFGSGHLGQGNEILREGRVLFAEYAQVEGGSTVLTAPAGLAGHPVSATMIVAGRDAGRELLARLRAVEPPAGGLGGVTTLPGVMVARCLGRSAEAARAYFVALWKLARPALAGRDAVPPRIWRC